MRTTVRSYIKGSIYEHLREFNPPPTFKGELVARKTDDELIAEELVKAEREKKERELLEAQLKLPRISYFHSHGRNKYTYSSYRIQDF